MINTPEMSRIFYFIAFLFFANATEAQVNQVTIGASNVNLTFNSVKYDASDGGTINVGYRNDQNTTTGNDCYMVKLNSHQQIVWQRVFPNTGDDYFNKVVIGKNGDYIMVGKLTQNGILRGFACRVNKNNGNIIWASNSVNSNVGEIFYDLVETKDGNIAISGTDSYYPGITNIFIVLLNSAGSTIWSEVSSYGSSDEPFAINQLPNGNIIVGAFEWVGYYNAIIMELSEKDGTVLSENYHSISTFTPSGIFVNSLWPTNITIKNGKVLFSMNVFQGCCSESNMAIYNYDLVTKQLSGNIYHHSGHTNLINYAYAPIGENDFLISQSFANPKGVYVSRVSNGSITYDNLLGNPVISVNAMDTTASNIVYAGQFAFNNYTNTYNLFSSRDMTTAAADCNIAKANTLVLQSSTLDAGFTSDITLSPSVALIQSSVTNETSDYPLSSICGSPVIELPKAPAVSLTAPVNNDTYTAPATITLRAAATDDDGTISKVQFYNGAMLLYTDSTGPYSYVIDSLPVGNYSFVAKATDNSGLVSNSATVNISVLSVPKKAPFVSITNPANNTTYLASSTISFTATASDSDGSINNVKFYNGSTLLKTDSTSPYGYTMYDAAQGNYKIFAKATDNDGLTNSSETVSVFVVPVTAKKAPVVTIISPANSTIYKSPATITLNATATDADGTISAVQFYNGSALLYTDSTYPYSYTLNNAPAGNYSFTAKAADNSGLKSTSSTVAVAVSPPAVNKAPTVNIVGPPSNNAVYLARATFTIHATASDPDGKIKSVKFYNGSTLVKTDDSNPYSYTMSNAAAGSYKFFAKATDNKGMTSASATISIFVVPGAAGKAPVVNLTSPFNNTKYNAPASITLTAEASDADGLITSVQFYNGATLLNTDSTRPYSYTINSLAAGNYSFAAKAIDDAGLSSNSSTVAVSVAKLPNKAPFINMIAPANNSIYIAPAPIILEAAASDPDGTISSVKFYNGSTLLKTDSTSPYNFTLNNLPAGNYKFFAKATDNQGLPNSSGTVSVVVIKGSSRSSGKAVMVSVKSSTTSIAEAAVLKLSPDPAHNTLNIYTKGLQHRKHTTITIISASGVIMKTVQPATLTPTIQVNVSPLAKGVYILRISNGNKIMHKQFVKI